MVWVVDLGLAFVVLPHRERGGVGRNGNGTLAGTREVHGQVHVERALTFARIGVHGVVRARESYGSSSGGGGFAVHG